jgi:hypothetical protein
VLAGVEILGTTSGTPISGTDTGGGADTASVALATLTTSVGPAAGIAGGPDGAFVSTGGNAMSVQGHMLVAATPDVPADAPLIAPPPPPVEPLTVRSVPSPVLAAKEATEFVKVVAATSPAIDQIARWHTPICISVAGISDDQQARVAARIQEVAAGVGLRTLPAGCKANVEVVFTDKPQAFMDQVAKTREEVLGYYHRHDRDKLKVVTRPIQAWYVTNTASGGADTASVALATLTTTVGTASGLAGGPDGAFVNSGQGALSIQGHMLVADDPDNSPPAGCADSPAFTHCLTSGLSNVLIVVDTNKIQGQKLGPLTDYLSLVALSQVRSFDGCNALASILDRLGKGCGDREAPEGLTSADAAYLTALYVADLEKNKALEQEEIAGRMTAMLTKRGGR